MQNECDLCGDEMDFIGPRIINLLDIRPVGKRLNTEEDIDKLERFIKSLEQWLSG